MKRDFKDKSIIDLAAFVANHLKGHGIEVILVGGLAVILIANTPGWLWGGR